MVTMFESTVSLIPTIFLQYFVTLFLKLQITRSVVPSNFVILFPQLRGHNHIILFLSRRVFYRCRVSVLLFTKCFLRTPTIIRTRRPVWAVSRVGAWRGSTLVGNPKCLYRPLRLRSMVWQPFSRGFTGVTRQTTWRRETGYVEGAFLLGVISLDDGNRRPLFVVL